MAVVIATQAFLDLLRARRVYHRPNEGDRFRVGDRLSVPEDCRIEPYSHIFFGGYFPAGLGAFSYSHSSFRSHVRVGRYCSIGGDVVWMADRHPIEWASTSPFSYSPRPLQGVMTYLQHDAPKGVFYTKSFDSTPAPIEVGHDVWIGDGAMIREGVKIGDGAVVGARAVVTRDVPPYAIVVGTPARVLRLRFPEPIVERLLALQWWRFPPDVLLGLRIEDPEAFMDDLEQRLERDPSRAMTPAPLTFADIRQTVEMA